jgi:4-hydroxybenzoate polyprenyltransferase
MTPPPLKLRWTGLLLDYTRERLTAARLLAAVLLVIIATLAGGGWSGSAALATDALLALALVVTFRIWDDLVDRDRDRLKHPGRVVVRATASSTAPLRAAGCILALGALITIHRVNGHDSALLLWLYLALLGISYRLRGKRSAASERILLLKYGVFTLALIGLPDAFSARGLSAAAAAFFAACVYEWWHDTESPVFSFGGSR